MTSQFQEKLFFWKDYIICFTNNVTEIPVQSLDGIVLVILKSPLMN